MYYVIIENKGKSLCYEGSHSKESAMKRALVFRKQAGNTVVIKVMTKEEWKKWYMNCL